MSKVSAVLWDLDDTLINTTVTRVQAQAHVAETLLSLLPANVTATMEELTQKLERLVSLFGSTYYVQHISLLCQELVSEPVLCQQLIATGCQAYREAFWRIAAIDGARETLEALRSQGLKLGLVSNGLYPVQIKKLKCAGLSQYFEPDMIFVSSHYSRRFGLPPGSGAYNWAEIIETAELEQSWLKNDIEKPWPWMLERALNACGCSPEQTIYVGDRATDYVSARLAGVWSIKIGQAHHSDLEPALVAIEQPDFAIDQMVDIFSVIDQINSGD